LRLTTRVHEWLAERVPWIQFPDLRRDAVFQRERLPLTRKQRAWLAFAVFWSLVVLLSIYGNLTS
jgi:hypothetical protein